MERDVSQLMLLYLALWGSHNPSSYRHGITCHTTEGKSTLRGDELITALSPPHTIYNGELWPELCCNSWGTYY